MVRFGALPQRRKKLIAIKGFAGICRQLGGLVYGGVCREKCLQKIIQQRAPVIPVVTLCDFNIGHVIAFFQQQFMECPGAFNVVSTGAIGEKYL